MDSLHIAGIRAYGYIGVLPEEQTLGQWFEVDLTLWLDLSIAGKSDRLEDTHDYQIHVTVVQQLIQTAKFKLIETLAETIAHHLLKSDDITQVRVRVIKLTPPIPHFNGTVAAEITRSRTVKNLPVLG
ncbi:MAG: dihydroneopterin aldolase [Cyanobacteria bacterium CRU_2_1]|nr:dihydroneopterin aldolase [Cyanobacteria bacterium RU_5_0]NJR59035.1 dihydroneopterin aldolase [Cyanobacteria bacterium CRU_2_1]